MDNSLKNRQNARQQNCKAVIILMLLSLFLCSFAIVKPGVFNDGVFHIGRIKALSHDISVTNLKPWMYSQTYFGVGYPLGIFYPDLILYPFALIVKMGVDVYIGFLILIFAINFFSGISAYYCLMKIFRYEKMKSSESKALVAAMFYVVYPFRVWDLYFKMAIGESMSFVFIPFVFLGVYEIFKQNQMGISLFFGMTGVIHSHILSVVIISFFLIAFYVMSAGIIVKQPRILLNTAINAVLTFLSSVGVIMPIIEMQSFTKMYYQTGIKTFGLLKDNAAGPSIPESLTLFLTIVMVVAAFVVSKKTGARGRLAIGLLLVVFMSSSLFAWGPLERIIPVINILQFPRRLLIVGSIPFAILVGLLTFNEKTIYYLLIGLVSVATMTLCIMVYSPLDGVDFFGEYSAGCGEYMVAEEELFFEKHSIEEIYSEYGIMREGNTFSFDVEKNRERDFYVLPLGYYKGYEITGSSGEILPYEKSENGFIQVEKGENKTVSVKYKGTVIQKTALSVSMVSFLGIVVCLFLNSKRKNCHEKGK